MSAITITENHPRWTLYSQLRKCGEVTASPDGRHFGLNCIYCPTIFPWTNIKELLGHLHEKHASELLKAGQQERKRQQQPQNAKKRKLCTSPVLPTSDAAERASTFREDPHEPADIYAVFIKEEEDPCSTNQELEVELVDIVEEVVKQPDQVSQTFSYSEDDESASKTQSKNNSENEDENEDENEYENEDEIEDENEAENEDEDEDEDEDDDEDKHVDDGFPGHKLDLISHENHEILSYIIEMHEEHTFLWDKENVLFQLFKKKYEIYRQIIEEIECRFKLTLTRKNIREAFAGLRKLYTEELFYGTEEPTTQLWCFEKLEFLKTSLLAGKAEPAIPIHQLIPLAEIYERHPVLWNLDSYESHNRMRQNAAQHQMLQEFNKKLGLNMTLKQFRGRLLRMRRYLRNDRRKRLKCEEDGSEEFEPQYEALYKKLEYLEPFIGPHRCDKCDKELLQYHAFKAHMAAHEGRLPFTCDICQKDFKIYANFEVHIRRHTGEKPFVCATCDKGFPSGTDLKFHERTHTGEKNLVCHVCGMAFVQLSGLIKHKAIHDTNRVRLPCPHCPKQFVSKRTLMDHINVHSQVRNAVCPDCGKSFFSRKTMRQHRQLHDKVKRYQCELCDKKFAQKAGLCSHRRTHKIAGIREEKQENDDE